MTRFVSSKPCSWVEPRAYQDASLRYRTHGKVRAMDSNRGFFARLFKRSSMK